MGASPTSLRKNYDQLVYLPQYEKKRIVCGGKKEPVTSLVQDAPQAYELMEPREAIRDLRWCMALAVTLFGFSTVTFVEANPAASFLGGALASSRLFTTPTSVLAFSEIHQFVAAIFLLTFVQVGDTVYRAPGTCTGNPMGRLALASVTGRDELEMDKNGERRN